MSQDTLPAPECQELKVERDERDRLSLDGVQQHGERTECCNIPRSNSTRISGIEKSPDYVCDKPIARERKMEILSFIDLMRRSHNETRINDQPAKKVGVVYEHLTVKGIATRDVLVKTLPDAIFGTFGPDLYRLLCRFLPYLSFNRNREKKRTLIHDFTGVVREGEILLVLGRPGAGCSTFLKVLANERKPYAEVTGEVTYGGIRAEEQKNIYSGEVIYTPEDDVHLPDLNVWQTLTFALMNKTKKREKGNIPPIVGALMRMLGISLTKHTKVGNEYLLGVSGGERKRVSIAETLATNSALLCLCILLGDGKAEKLKGTGRDRCYSVKTSVQSLRSVGWAGSSPLRPPPRKKGLKCTRVIQQS